MKRTKISQTSILKKIRQISNLMRGSIIHTSRKCGKKNCWCYKSKEGHPLVYLTLKSKEKVHNISINKEQLSKVRKITNEYKKLRNLIEDITLINLNILKEN